ncbi:Chitotriosidase-1 protein [Spatholobus suberectus]|nr:Chitotriosidase-1 protein [Spatholobus suberectus]
MAYDYYMPLWANFTAAHAALYDPSNSANTDNGIKKWIGSGVMASKLVLLGLSFYGYAWNLRNPKDNAIGASTTGPAITEGGDMNRSSYLRERGNRILHKLGKRTS